MANTKNAGSGMLDAAKKKLAGIATTQRTLAGEKTAKKQATRSVVEPATAAAPGRSSKPANGEGAARKGRGAVLATSDAGDTGDTGEAHAAEKGAIRTSANAAAPDRAVAAASQVSQAAATGKSALKKATKPAQQTSADETSVGSAKSGRAVSPKARTAGKPPRKIPAEQALANTLELLAAKKEQARQPQPWQAHDPERIGPADPDFQSPDAMLKATELHSGESNQDAIQGSIGTQDRHEQGKRDNR